MRIKKTNKKLTAKKANGTKKFVLTNETIKPIRAKAKDPSRK